MVKKTGKVFIYNFDNEVPTRTSHLTFSHKALQLTFHDRIKWNPDPSSVIKIGIIDKWPQYARRSVYNTRAGRERVSTAIKHPIHKTKMFWHWPYKKARKRKLIKKNIISFYAPNAAGGAYKDCCFSKMTW